MIHILIAGIGVKRVKKIEGYLTEKALLEASSHLS